LINPFDVEWCKITLKRLKSLNFPPTQRPTPRAETPDIVANLAAMDPTELLHLNKEGTLVPKPPRDMSKFIAWDLGLVGIDFLVNNRDLGT